MRPLLICTLLIPFIAFSQISSHQVDNEHIQTLISKYKKDPRGPYKDIRWFCDDSTIQMPKEPCEDGGIQHARYKDEVEALGDKSHIFLGQILAYTSFDEFWDQENYHSRIKQYMIEKYLKSVDDGWVNRRGQYYRGAIQAEDEAAWGIDFFHWLLKEDENIVKHFYFVRQAIKDIPHTGDDNVTLRMRSESKTIADEFEPFMNLRIKIHGQPQVADIQSVLDFKQKQASNLTPELNKQINKLVKTMKEYFKPVEVESLTKYLKDIEEKQIRNQIENYISLYQNESAQMKIQGASELMWFIREHILEEKNVAGRLALFDLSLKLESLITKQIDEYPDGDVTTLTDKICYLSTASAASGYTETWEWEMLQTSLSTVDGKNTTLEELNAFLVAARNQLEWGTGKNNAVFNPIVELYEGFEPLVHSFLDDRIRGSVALYLGNSIGKLGQFITEQSALSNQVLDIPNQSHLHGLNPGYALGKLVVVEGSAEDLSVNPNHIYVFGRPPSDLKPVAGILNVSEGNLVSHLQLLARNLGIPNTSLSNDNVNALKAFDGQMVFYAVSNKGNVIMKLEKDMTEVERKLFEKKERNTNMITVPTDKIKLDRTTIINLRELNAKSSGIYCGPKAANLGELKENFPDDVVEGFVIPFGIFLDHMKQTIPGKEQTYWDYLNGIFDKAKSMKASGEADADIEVYQLSELENLRQLIGQMSLKDSFLEDINRSFDSILGVPFGEQAVFLRSDTNMEDLGNFTGAGLNLTLFNVLEKEKILNGIKTVWASPYTERSFKWRQKLLNNPENVYPSIVVIPGVNNDYSGVMITKGVTTGKTHEVTVAFSKGVGGAVDGQAAETWTVKHTGEFHLIAPAREPFYKSLLEEGGVETKLTTFETPILSVQNIKQLNLFREELESKMEAKGIHGPFDVELGFKENKIWLFQVRPFVENKNALSSDYLQSITPEVDLRKGISLKTSL